MYNSSKTDSSKTATSQSSTRFLSSAFNPPAQPAWHRMIAEAAYFRAEKRNFADGDALLDWLLAEQEIGRQLAQQ